MAALDFPSSPTVNQQYPSPAVAGVPVYTWDGEKWTTKGGAIGSTGASDAVPLVDGTGAAGSSTLWSRGDHRHPTDPAIAAVDATKVAKAGDTMSGDLAVSTTGNSRFTLNSPVANINVLSAKKGGIGRWEIYPGDSATESGGNNGSNFVLVRMNDAGVVLGAPLQINRANGQIVIEADPTTALGVATKQYIDNKIGTWTDYWTATTKLVDASNLWASAAFTSISDADAAAGLNGNTMGINFAWTLGGAGKTLANPVNFKTGQSGMIYMLPGASGTITTWGTAWYFPGGIKPTLTPSGIDCIVYTARAPSVLICSFLKDLK